ncbi:MAG TPA: DUF4397 domain-containing protein [Gemmatimonadaceae bacterium]|nr:DUF4397 domain-containing protein [Gemmatimonadaceae bacterium]
MRLTSIAILSAASVALSACGGDKVTTPNIPPTAQVRFINALNDTGAVDIHAVDQIEFSPVANNLNYRAGTVYFATEAGSRHFRVFPTSTNIAVTSQIIDDESVTITADTRVTLLLTGSARAKTAHFVLISDDTQAPPTGQISVRMVNTAPAAVDGYLVNTATDPLPGTATFANVASLASSGYTARGAGAAAVRATDPGTATVRASQNGPAAPATLPGEFPAAGVGSGGTKFSVYYFPAGVAGSPQNGVANPSLVWFVDRNPCDGGC